jgi:hypothetical protein
MHDPTDRVTRTNAVVELRCALGNKAPSAQDAEKEPAMALNVAALVAKARHHWEECERPAAPS